MSEDTSAALGALRVECRFSEPLDPGGPEILKSFHPVRVRISQNLSPL